MFNDKFNKPFVDFLNRHFNPTEHLILCKRCFKEYPFPEGANVVELATYRMCDFSLPNIRKVICHSLFDSEVVELLYQHRDVLHDKACWVMWGGDLYQAPRTEVNDFVRRNIAFRCTVADGDKNVADERCGVCRKTFLCAYAVPTTLDMIDDALKKRKPHRGLNIQINNSCDSTILEMLDQLSRFAHEDVNIWTFLSYGDLSVKDAVIKRGRELFGCKYHPVVEMLAPARFVESMASMDVLCFNQQRQQGLGNAVLAAAMGVKLYIRADVTSYTHLNSQGINCYDTLGIDKQSFNDFCAFPSDIKSSSAKVARLQFDENELAKKWVPVFSDSDGKI